MKTTSIHVVRHYGPVGGMENYVYQLTQALAEQGQQVMVLCERSAVAQEDVPFDVVVLGARVRKPRWLAQWCFARAVARYVDEQLNPSQSLGKEGYIIHSHERTSVHQVTTFHGPPFLMRKKRYLDFLSPRIHMWTRLERQELLGDHVRAILPNSPLIAQQLGQLYPSIQPKIQAPAYPGVDKSFDQVQSSNQGLTIGFMGREWRRKGLDIAIAVVEQLRQRVPGIKLVVAGCDKEEVLPLFAHWQDSEYELMGWVDNPLSLLEKADILLHPARAEPFGMVIAEANAAGLPVVVSDRCGAAALIGQSQGAVCSIDESGDVSSWVEACYQALHRQEPVVSLGLSWQSLAKQHIALYQEVCGALCKTSP